MEEYLYTPLQKLAVGKILRTSRPDRSATRGQTVKKVTTTLIQKKLTVGVATVRLPGPISTTTKLFLQERFAKDFQPIQI
jgi:hypothetical protein